MDKDNKQKVEIANGGLSNARKELAPPLTAAAEAPPTSGLLQQVAESKESSKKKKKKKKLTAKERTLERLEKASEKFLEDADQLNPMLSLVTAWLRDKHRLVHRLLAQNCTQEGEHSTSKRLFERKKELMAATTKDETELRSYLNAHAAANEPTPPPPPSQQPTLKIDYDEFKKIVSDLEIPCTRTQLHVLCKLLDPELSGQIDFRRHLTPEFILSHVRHEHNDGLKLIRRSAPPRKPYASTFEFETKPFQHFASRPPKYIKIDVKLVTFANEPMCKCHLKDEVVYTHLKVYSLVELIRNKLDICSIKLVIYEDAARLKQLDEKKTLEECGYEGDPSYDKVAALASSDKHVLFYDYAILNNNDPILNCDFYFI